MAWSGNAAQNATALAAILRTRRPQHRSAAFRGNRTSNWTSNTPLTPFQRRQLIDLYSFMAKIEPDNGADMKAATDRGESISLMEPLLIGGDSRHRPELTDLAVELAVRSAGFRRSLPDSLLGSLSGLVRATTAGTARSAISSWRRGPISPSSTGSTRADSRTPPRRPTQSRKSTGALARNCPTTCCGSKIPRPRTRSELSRANSGTAMCRWAATSPSARLPCPAS